MLPIYRAITFVAFVIALPVLSILARVRPERWRSRLGREAALPRGAVWVHAASVGETLGARPLVEAIAAAAPPGGVALSTMTPAGLRVVRDLALPVAATFLVPFDFPQAVERHLDALAPSALIVVETELWPNLLDAARRRGIPVAIVNARISGRAAARYRALRRLFHRALSGAAWIAAQTEADRDRFVAIGARAEAVDVVGSTKGDARPDGRTRAEVRASLGLAVGDLLVVFGSARTAEDDVFVPAAARLLAARRAVRVLYAPRHVERVPALLARLAEASLAPRAITEWRASGGDGRVLVLDTLGELRTLYAAADVAVIGGSFSRHGGHNPLEAAQRGAPVLMGPHRQNVREAFARLEAGGGAEAVEDGETLGRAIDRLLDDPDLRAERARRILAACDGGSPVTARLMEGLARCGVVRSASPDTANPGRAVGRIG